MDYGANNIFENDSIFLTFSSSMFSVNFFFNIFTVVVLQGNFTFIQSAKIKDFVTDLHLTPAPRADSAATRYVRDILYLTKFLFCYPTKLLSKLNVKLISRVSVYLSVCAICLLGGHLLHLIFHFLNLTLLNTISSNLI